MRNKSDFVTQSREKGKLLSLAGLEEFRFIHEMLSQLLKLQHKTVFFYQGPIWVLQCYQSLEHPF